MHFIFVAIFKFVEHWCSFSCVYMHVAKTVAVMVSKWQ